MEITIFCMNKFRDYNYEVIKLYFIDLIAVRFVENRRHQSTCINATFISNENGVITFDFFPEYLANNEQGEDENSDFSIKCKEVRYIRVP